MLKNLECQFEWHTFKPHLVLCDVNMPEMSGIELLKAMHSVDPGMPIVQMSSGQGAEHFLKIAKTLGAVKSMDNMVDTDTVLEVVKAALGKNA